MKALADHNATLLRSIPQKMQNLDRPLSIEGYAAARSTGYDFNNSNEKRNSTAETISGQICINDRSARYTRERGDTRQSSDYDESDLGIATARASPDKINERR